MLVVPWEGSHTAAGPTPWLDPCYCHIRGIDSPKTGLCWEFHHQPPPSTPGVWGCPYPNSKMRGCPIATCSRVDLASCKGSQPVFFAPGTVPPPSPSSPAGARTATAPFLPAIPSPTALRPWLPSAPDEQHVKPSSVSPPCPEKGGDRVGDAGVDWLEEGRTSCPRAACTALRA